MFVFALKASWLDQQIMAVKEYNATQLYSRIFVILFNRAVALTALPMGIKWGFVAPYAISDRQILRDFLRDFES